MRYRFLLLVVLVACSEVSSPVPGTDAASTDASSADASRPEASGGDSSSTDASSTDASTTDASMVDALEGAAGGDGTTAADGGPADSGSCTCGLAHPCACIAQTDAGLTLADGAPLADAAQAFVTTYAQPYCAQLAACCASANIATTGIEACEASELSAVEPYLDDGAVVMVPSAVQTFLGEIGSTCTQPPYGDWDRITTGTKPPGASCTDGAECAGDPSACLIPGSAKAGTCVQPAAGTLGSPCDISCNDSGPCRYTVLGGAPVGVACFENSTSRLFCDPTTNTCASVAAVGSPCSGALQCGAHGTCMGTACQALAQVGADCSAAECDSTLICDVTTMKCQHASIATAAHCSP